MTSYFTRVSFGCIYNRQVLAKLKSITHELESKELDVAAKNLQVRVLVFVAVACCPSTYKQK